MPAVCRAESTDSCTGHGCYPPRKNTSGSGDVYVNSKECHRQGDGWQPHGCGVCTPHGGNTSAGSGTVYVNGKQIGRIGDPISCGSSIASGSSDVFAGG